MKKYSVFHSIIQAAFFDCLHLIQLQNEYSCTANYQASLDIAEQTLDKAEQT